MYFPINSYKTAPGNTDPQVTREQGAKGCKPLGKENPPKILKTQLLGISFRIFIS